MALLGRCILDFVALGTLQFGVCGVIVVAVQAQFAQPFGSEAGVSLPVGELGGTFDYGTVRASALALGDGGGLREWFTGQTRDADFQFGALIQLLDSQVLVVGNQVVLALGALIHVQVDTLARLAGFFLLALAAVAHADLSLGSPVAGGVPGLVELLGAHGAGPHGGGLVTILTRLSWLALAGLSGLAAFLGTGVSSLLAPLLVEGGETSFTPLAVFGLEGQLVGAEAVGVLLLCAVDTLVALVVLIQDAHQGLAVEHGFA